MQVDAKVNGQKSDKLPSARLLVDRRSAILEDWEVLRCAMPDAFDRQASHLLGGVTQVTTSMTNELFARFKEAVEVTALQRGVERWALWRLHGCVGWACTSPSIHRSSRWYAGK